MRKKVTSHQNPKIGYLTFKIVDQSIKNAYLTCVV